ncbi:uncharacterized protein LOC120352407 [Nilaparvata lugens]|uniref:uncharacterized protein LOC120352407 n=1 Tax=Nilaparvata lugens TaxID=108931 RepID=UPI00193D6872|nr:uncharacterized protein LOC120352407 [Nilaparvata lugens]XP_039288663.1 uncharacterized protein LOC120352407 [Nilaparvata lugens]
MPFFSAHAGSAPRHHVLNMTLHPTTASIQMKWNREPKIKGEESFKELSKDCELIRVITNQIVVSSPLFYLLRHPSATTTKTTQSLDKLCSLVDCCSVLFSLVSIFCFQQVS